MPGPILHRCRGCSHFRRQEEFIAGVVVGFCLHCHERHGKALQMFANTLPLGCQECEATFEQLAERQPGADIRMRLYGDKDGIFQMLCPPCGDEYEKKRLDYFGDTPYGAAKKLKGAH